MANINFIKIHVTFTLSDTDKCFQSELYLVSKCWLGNNSDLTKFESKLFFFSNSDTYFNVY